MEKIYSTKKNVCETPKAGPETIRFLLDYSRALRITKHREFSFDLILN
ncbi:hypothetical protein [Muriicola marianensis]|nr:hypothetical protein [Muriicola marianensis]